MDKIESLDELRTILAGLKQRGLVVPITPEGRGHVITHNLYFDRELAKVRGQYSAVALSGEQQPDMHEDVASVSSDARSVAAPAPAASNSEDIGLMRSQIETLGSQVVELRELCESLAGQLERTRDDLARIKEDLGL